MTNRFYFTFGTSDIQPFTGGWVEVFALTREKAIEKFTEKYPRVDGVIPCAFIYTEEDFKTTTMYLKQSNLGASCYEIIE